MLTLGQQKIDALTLAFVAAVALAVTALSVLVPGAMPWTYVALAVLPAILYTAVRWEITLWAWLWVLSFGLLDFPQGHIAITGFFNLTVPRLVLLAALLAFGIHFMVRRRRGVHFDRGVLWAMLLLTAICGISAARTGWLAQTEAIRTAPYYRFLEAMVLPFLVFFLVYNATREERQIRTALLALSAYVWYALYIGYLQFAALRGAEGLRVLIWPPYINDPTYGIHFDRARGAFGSAGQQAILLVLVFYGDLFLLRKLRGAYRGALILQTVLIPPAIFFTGVRSAFVAFLLCGIVWCLLAARRRLGGVKLALGALALLVMTTVFWDRLAQSDRQAGGVGDVGPVVARGVLAHQTWLLLQQHPLTGVGFGKFVDAQRTLRHDPTSLAGMSAGVLVEHNLFLNMAAEVGVVGLVAVVLVFFLVFRESVKLYRKLPEESEGWLCRTFVVLFWVALINYLTDAMFRDTYWDAFANGLFWSLAALVVGCNRMLGPVAWKTRLAPAAV